MIFKPAIDNSLPLMLKAVNEQALREAPMLDSLQALYHHFKKLYPTYDIYKELTLTYIIKMPNHHQAYAQLSYLRYHVRAGSPYILATGSIENWCDYVINVLIDPFDEALTLGYYLQVNSIYTELIPIAPQKLVYYRKLPVINDIFVLVGR